MKTKKSEKWASTKVKVFGPAGFAFDFATARIARFPRGASPVFPNIRTLVLRRLHCPISTPSAVAVRPHGLVGVVTAAHRCVRLHRRRNHRVSRRRRPPQSFPSSRPIKCRRGPSLAPDDTRVRHARPTPCPRTGRQCRHPWMGRCCVGPCTVVRSRVDRV